MIAFISERNLSRRVVLPLFFHANPANVCCFPTRPSLVLLFRQYPAELRFPQHRTIGLVQSFLSGGRVVQRGSLFVETALKLPILECAMLRTIEQAAFWSLFEISVFELLLPVMRMKKIRPCN